MTTLTLCLAHLTSRDRNMIRVSPLSTTAPNSWHISPTPYQIKVIYDRLTSFILLEFILPGKGVYNTFSVLGFTFTILFSNIYRLPRFTPVVRQGLHPVVFLIFSLS